MKYYNKRHLYMDAVDSNYTNILVGKLISSAKLKKKQKILEIGCGRGRFSTQLLEKGYNLTGVDSSEAMLRKFKNVAKKNVKLIKGDFNVIYKKYKGNFDVVIGFYILHHLKDLNSSLMNIGGVLKRNGIVAFIEPNPYNPMYYAQLLFYKDMSWKKEKGMLNMKKKKLLKTFTETGFKNFQLIQFGFLPPFLMNISIGTKIDTMLEGFKALHPIRPYQLIMAKRC